MVFPAGRDLALDSDSEIAGPRGMMGSMARTTKRAETVLELCIARAIYVRGGDPASMLDNLAAMPQGQSACIAVVLWAMAAKSLGHMPTTVEFADFWRISERMGWKYRSRVTRLFPGDEFVQVVDQVARHVPDVSSVDSIRAASKVAPSVKLGRSVYPVPA